MWFLQHVSFVVCIPDVYVPPSWWPCGFKAWCLEFVLRDAKLIRSMMEEEPLASVWDRCHFCIVRNLVATDVSGNPGLESQRWENGYADHTLPLNGLKSQECTYLPGVV